MLLQCTSCPFRANLEPGERRPPWCPRCGADVKEAAPEQATVAAGAGTPAVSPAATPALATGASRAALADGFAAGHLPDAGAPAQIPAAPQILPPVTYEGVGAAVEVFRGKFGRQAAAWGCMVVCLGIALAAGSQLAHPPKGQEAAIYGCLGLFGLGSLVAGYVGFRLAGQKFGVFPDRLVQWQSFSPTAYGWDQVREIYQDMHPGWTTFRVVAGFGREFTIGGDIADHTRLGEIISERLTARLLPAALAELQAGRDVRLGPLRINPSGVVIDGQLEPWHRVGIPQFGLDPSVKRETGRFSNMMHAYIGGSKVELGKIPNYGLLQALAFHFSRAA